MKTIIKKFLSQLLMGSALLFGITLFILGSSMSIAETAEPGIIHAYIHKLQNTETELKDLEACKKQLVEMQAKNIALSNDVKDLKKTTSQKLKEWYAKKKASFKKD